MVVECIYHLMLLGVVSLVPVFQYSNIYRPTPKLSLLAKCKTMQKRCIDQCTKVDPTNQHLSRPQAKIRDCFRIFSSMAHGATFGELCVRFNPAELNINERQLVLFGLLEGIIRRVEKFPITVQRNVFYDRPISPTIMLNDQLLHNNSGSQPLPRDQREGISHRLHRNRNFDDIHRNPKKHSTQDNARSLNSHNCYYYNGLKSYDEICTKRGISCQQLDAQLSKDRHVIVLLR